MPWGPAHLVSWWPKPFLVPYAWPVLPPLATLTVGGHYSTVCLLLPRVFEWVFPSSMSQPSVRPFPFPCDLDLPLWFLPVTDGACGHGGSLAKRLASFMGTGWALRALSWGSGGGPLLEGDGARKFPSPLEQGLEGKCLRESTPRESR